jgi:hypothetical protein
MPHRIDIDGISRNLFILINLAYASEHFCEEARVNRSDGDAKTFGWSYYIGWLKSTVSEVLIETAIKYRILQDFLQDEDFGPVDFSDLDKRARGDMLVGRFFPSGEALPLREACNKIIHAKEVRLSWISRRHDEGSYEFWNGDVFLEGQKGQVYWECELYAVNFCIALQHSLSLLEDLVDWHDVYKYDE